ncbi:MAG: dihydroorotase [Pseudomonadota bacterium]
METTHFINARLIDPDSGTDAPGALTMSAGVITARFGPATLAETGAETRDDTVVDCAGKCLAPGIVDIGVKVCEPGERHKESYATAGRAAAAGGVTTMVTRPDTDPTIDTPEILEFVAKRAQADSIVRVLPMAALTKGRAGAEMTEIGFLKDAGAVAFTDCDHVVRNPKVFSRALSYARATDALVIAHIQEPTLSDGACATSGKFASLRGLPAVSPMAEQMGLERDLALVELTGARYHADQITTEKGLNVLARGKHAGLAITAGTSIHHLTLNAFDVADYRTFFKLKPPLRDETDRSAMVEALASGLIDIVSSMHTPQDEESKRLPFEEAASGAVALETLLPAAMRLVHGGHIDLPTLWRALSLNPAKLLGLAQGRLEVGAPADLVLFDPDAPFQLNRFELRSKSKNTPFDDARLQGKVLGTWIGGERVFGDH